LNLYTSKGATALDFDLKQKDSKMVVVWENIWVMMG